jgi:hypothetical protein
MKRPSEPRCTRRVVSDSGFNYLLAASLMPSPVFSVAVLTTFSGVFGRDLGPMANVFGARLRGLADFLSCMLNDMTGLGCSFVHAVGSILTNLHREPALWESLQF